MSRKSARLSLDFDSPKWKWVVPLFTKKRAPELIAASQDEDDFDCERDSVRSNSSQSMRIRLQQNFRIIDQKPADSMSPATIKD
jgi:hypothetical protein